MTDKQAALGAALAQIDRAFGKDSPAWRDVASLNVWVDPFTVDVVKWHIIGKIHEHVDDDNFDPKLLEWLIDDIHDSIDAGEHRTLDYCPLDRMYPPVTFGERVSLFVHRLFAGFR